VIKLKNQVAVITCSSSGIGHGLAAAFAREVARVVANDPHEEQQENAQALCAQIQAYGGAAIAAQTDVAVESDVQTLVSTALDAFGRMINTASQLAYKGWPGLAHYTAAKGAIMAFTRTLALEICEREVLANSVAPGATHTPILADMPAELLEKIGKAIPTSRLTEFSDIVPTYVFLASQGARLYQGQCLSPNRWRCGAVGESTSQPLDHPWRVQRGRSDPQPLGSLRHRREVDGLQVYAVLQQQLFGDALATHRIADDPGQDLRIAFHGCQL